MPTPRHLGTTANHSSWRVIYRSNAEVPEDPHLKSEQDICWLHFKTPKSQNVNATGGLRRCPRSTGDAVIPGWTNRVIPSDDLRLHHLRSKIYSIRGKFNSGWQKKLIFHTDWPPGLDILGNSLFWMFYVKLTIALEDRSTLSWYIGCYESQSYLT